MAGFADAKGCSIIASVVQRGGAQAKITMDVSTFNLLLRYVTLAVGYAAKSISDWIDFRRVGKRERETVRNLERSASPAQPRLKMTGHLTEAVYRRYAIVDEAMLREASTKLAALHRGEAAKTSEVSRSANERATIRPDADREDSLSRLLLFVSVALSCATGRQTHGLARSNEPPSPTTTPPLQAAFHTLCPRSPSSRPPSPLGTYSLPALLRVHLSRPLLKWFLASKLQLNCLIVI